MNKVDYYEQKSQLSSYLVGNSKLPALLEKEVHDQSIFSLMENQSEDQGPKIVQLPPDVINQIAAGEVIHQPFNVVKELFENALDAGATQIEIRLENGGFSSIQIIDNGCGISKGDLPIVCMRHTTSKIHQFIDLVTVLSTFGFRGEALFSMSCVSHLSITTKTQNDDVALTAFYENGQMIGTPDETAGNVGTTIEVRDLFYNKPEKLRAIPDSNSQNRQILQMATQYSIAYPEISIIVTIDGKEKLHTFGDTNTESVLALIYGLTTNSAIFRVEADLGNKVQAQLFLGTVAASRTMKGSAIFVNYRLVRCEKVKRALESVYTEFLMKGDKPFFVVMLFMPQKMVDVNVHPTKKDVNFANSQFIIENLCKVAHDHLVERIGGKTFKQTEKSQSTLETAFSKSKKVPVSKKSDFDDFQIKGSVQSAVITNPTPARSRNSIFEELKYKNASSTKQTLTMNKETNQISASNAEPLNQESNPDHFFEVDNEIPEEPEKNFTNEQNPAEFNSIEKNQIEVDSFNTDQNLLESNCQSEQESQFDYKQTEMKSNSQFEHNSQSEEEDDDDSIEENELPKQNESPKRQFGLNLQPLSHIQTDGQNTTAGVTTRPTFSIPKKKKLFEDLKYEPKQSKLTRVDPYERTIDQMFTLMASTKTVNESAVYRSIDIESISELKKREKSEKNEALCQLFQKSKFVGTIELTYVFFSSDETLYMCELFGLTRQFFYQLFLRHFGNYGLIEFNEPLDILTLIHLFRIESTANFDFVGMEVDDEYDYVIKFLNSHSDLLEDYFKIGIKENLLLHMPDILPGYSPSFTPLGLFFIRLASEVDWSCEFDCISGIIEELSMLYAVQVEDGANEELSPVMKQMIENVVMPEIKTEAFMPKESLVSDRILTRVKSATEMYKIFERT